LAVQWVQNNINQFVAKHIGSDVDTVIAADTDSNYVTFKAIVDKSYTLEKQKNMGTLAIIRHLDNVCEKVIAPQIKKYCQNLADYTNAYEQKLEMKREALADKAIWVKKKNYMINIYNNEGVEYTKPKLKIVGMAAIKSSTPGICRKKVKEAYEIIINQDLKTLREFNEQFRLEFMNMEVQDIAAPTGMNGLEKYSEYGGDTLFKKKTPAHVKGSIVFNHFLKKKDLLKKYHPIKEGEKLKWVYLKQPNPLGSEVLSFTTVIPEEFQIDQYIDYPAMYEKNYLVQITRVTEAIGWELEERSNLLHLFE
jgi:hypothetical protein